MSQVLEQARHIRAKVDRDAAEAKSKAFDSVIEIAIRENQGKSAAGDAQDLVDSLRDAEMTEEDFRSIIEAMPRAVSLEAQAQRCRELAAQLSEARDDFARIKSECESSIRLARLRVSGCDTGAQLNTIESYQRELRAKFPFLFSEAGKLVHAKPAEIKRELDALRQADADRWASLEEEQRKRVEGLMQRRRGVVPAQPEAKPAKATPKRKPEVSALPSINDGLMQD